MLCSVHYFSFDYLVECYKYCLIIMYSVSVWLWVSMSSSWQNSYHQLVDHFIFYYFIKAATKNFKFGRFWCPQWTKQNNGFFFSTPPLIFCFYLMTYLTKISHWSVLKWDYLTKKLQKLLVEHLVTFWFSHHQVKLKCSALVITWKFCKYRIRVSNHFKV